MPREIVLLPITTAPTATRTARDELLREAGVDADAYAKLLAAGITCAGDATTPEQE